MPEKRVPPIIKKRPILDLGNGQVIEFTQVNEVTDQQFEAMYWAEVERIRSLLPTNPNHEVKVVDIKDAKKSE